MRGERLFVGHFGVGLAAKPLARRTSLGTLFLAAQWVDLLWPTLLLLGVERVEVASGATRLTPLEFTHYPVTHSLVAALGWALLFAIVYYAVRRIGVAALVCGGLVLSHWILDLLTHKPDLPLYPGGSRVGLGLWNHPAVAVPFELGIFAAGVWLYRRETVAKNRVGVLAFWSLVAFFLVVYVMNLFAPPPPSSGAVAWASQSQWLLVAWGYWVDRHRRAHSRT